MRGLSAVESQERGIIIMGKRPETGKDENVEHPPIKGKKMGRGWRREGNAKK